MAEYKAVIERITKVDDRIDITCSFWRDDESFPGPTISVDAETATREEAIELIRDALRRFKAGYDAEAQLQRYVGVEITL